MLRLNITVQGLILLKKDDSNTTNVKVKLLIFWQIFKSIQIQIQPMLRLNEVAKEATNTNENVFKYNQC